MPVETSVLHTSFSMAFYDSFSLWNTSLGGGSKNSIANEYFIVPTPSPVRVIMTTAEQQAVGMQTDLSSITDSVATAVVTGNPSLESWAVDDSDVIQQHISRELLYGKPNQSREILDELVGVVYAGGYGEGYDSSLFNFCLAAIQLSNSNTSDSNSSFDTHSTSPSSDNDKSATYGNADNSLFRFVFSPHPGYPSSYEAQLFEKWGCLPYVLIIGLGESKQLDVEDDNQYSQEDDDHIDSSIITDLNSLTTSQIIVASNASISQCSTVGGQSLSVGVPHVYTYVPATTVSDAGSEICQDVFTDADLIPQAFSTSDLAEVLDSQFKVNDYTVDPTVMHDAGVPTNGTENVLEAIYLSLRRNPTLRAGVSPV